MDTELRNADDNVMNELNISDANELLAELQEALLRIVVEFYEFKIIA